MTVYTTYKSAFPGFSEHLDHTKPKDVIKSVYNKGSVNSLIQFAKVATSAVCAKDKLIQKLVKACLKKIEDSKIKNSQKSEVKALKKCYKK